MATIRIVHISDLHLFVDADGNARPWSDREVLVRTFCRAGTYSKAVAGLAAGFNTHYGPALTALLDALDGLVSAAAVAEQPLIVVQTGDVSTFGASPHGSVTFPEWTYWVHKVAAPLRERIAAWIDLHGNHDAWPGTLPLFAFWRARRAVRELRADYLPERLPRRVDVRFGPHRLDLYLVDTVCAAADANTLALGDLATDCDARDVKPDEPYPLSKSFDPLDELQVLESRAPELPAGGRIVRALVMHHPPHYFDKRNRDGKPTGHPLTEGVLAGADELGTLLVESPFELVIAGHRHAVDPALAGPRAQPPLPRDTLQLVCGSPTQSPGANDADPSFSVYELSVDERGQLRVTRDLHVLEELPEPRFVVRSTQAPWTVAIR
jgi:hypothetical protein